MCITMLGCYYARNFGRFQPHVGRAGTDKEGRGGEGGRRNYYKVYTRPAWQGGLRGPCNF